MWLLSRLIWMSEIFREHLDIGWIELPLILLWICLLYEVSSFYHFFIAICLLNSIGYYFVRFDQWLTTKDFVVSLLHRHLIISPSIILHYGWLMDILTNHMPLLSLIPLFLKLSSKFLQLVQFWILLWIFKIYYISLNDLLFRNLLLNYIWVWKSLLNLESLLIWCKHILSFLQLNVKDILTLCYNNWILTR